MPQHKSAIKRVRQIAKRNAHNRHLRSTMRTLVKKVTKISDKAEAETALRAAVAVLDRMAVKGIIHRNKAANQKSSLTKYVNNL